MRLVRVRDALLWLTVAVYSAGGAALGLVALVPVTVGQILARRWTWIGSPLDRPLLALLLAATASGVGSPWRQPALPLALGLAGLFLVLFPPVLAHAAAGPARVARLLEIWVAGGVAAALWGLAGLRPSYPFVSTASLTQNGLGLTMALALVIALGLWSAAGGRARSVLTAAVPVLGAVLVVAMARAAWLGAAAGVVTLLVVSRPPARRRLAMALLAAVLAGGLLVPRWPFLQEQVRSIFLLQANRNRLDIWQSALRMAADYPVFGVGLGAFGEAYLYYRTPGARDVTAPFAHNVFLHVAAEMGLLGLAAFTAFCAAALAAMVRGWARSPPDSAARDVAGTVLSATATLLTIQLFDTTLVLVHLGVGLFILFALGAGGERWSVRAPQGGGGSS